jgi:hypothetical protein
VRSRGIARPHAGSDHPGLVGGGRVDLASAKR